VLKIGRQNVWKGKATAQLLLLLTSL